MHKIFNKCIELANALFEPNYEARCQVFSFGFYGNCLLAVGRNKIKTHTWNVRNPLVFKNTGEIYKNKGICAECHLFLQIKNKTNIPYKEIKVINVRITKDRTIKNSRPCSSCSNWLKVLQPKFLYFTNDLGIFERY